jgi:hypothetical protein
MKSEINIPSYWAKPPEMKEMDGTIHSRYLAGAFEVGSSMGFHIFGNNGSIKVYPALMFRESEAFVTLFQKEFGGHKHKIKNSKSWRWSLSGQKAAEVAANMKPYCVSRREIVGAMQEWLIAADGKNNMKIALEVKNRHNFSIGSAEDYRLLANDPAFIAGVIDNKGWIKALHDNGRIYPSIGIRSKNKGLLDALSCVHGGKPKTEKRKGGSIGDRIIQEKEESYILEIPQGATKKLLELIEKYLIKKPFNGWNKRVVDELRGQRVARAQQLQAVVSRELEELRRGERELLSTRKDLAEQFRVHPETVDRMLELLPQGLRNEWGRKVHKLAHAYHELALKNRS